MPRAAAQAPSPAMRPAPLSARVTSTDTSMPKRRAGYQCWVGLLTAAAKSRKGTEKSFRHLQTAAIHIHLLTSASPKSSWFLPSPRSQHQGWDMGRSRVTQARGEQPQQSLRHSLCPSQGSGVRAMPWRWRAAQRARPQGVVLEDNLAQGH